MDQSPHENQLPREEPSIPAHPAPTDSDIAQAVATLLQDIPAVAYLHGGRALSLPGRPRPVQGVQITTESGRRRVEVQLVVAYSPALSLPELARTIRERIRQELDTMNVADIEMIDIVFVDIVEAGTRAP